MAEVNEPVATRSVAAVAVRGTSLDQFLVRQRDPREVAELRIGRERGGASFEPTLPHKEQ